MPAGLLTPLRPPTTPPQAVRRASVPPIDPLAYAPSEQRPLRAKLRRLAAATHIVPHRHPWAQVAMSSTGVIRMSAARSTYIVPPSRALWIPPDVEHVVTVLEDAEIRTLYVHPSARFLADAQAPDAASPFERWPACRVLEVSPLLRELVPHLDTAPGAQAPDERERCIAALVLDELRRAAPVRLGIDLPADHRLRRLCEAMLDHPTRWTALEDWAAHIGASPRTVARLFRSELGSSFGQWRQQVLLAHALAMAARKQPMATIAAELGYASASAFSAMVRRAVGQPPSRFFATAP
ncbi:MAG: helix-turn-helix transcriptional regulator [Rubrivivax sp.]|nr:helix-turn-helix transcriptional regulator [Rubrivivax sp.]